MSNDAAQPAVVLSERELRDTLRQSGAAALLNDIDRGRELDERILSSHAALAAQVEQLVELAHTAIELVSDEKTAERLAEDLETIIARGGYDEDLAQAKWLAGAFLVGLRITLERLPADPLSQTVVSRAFLETVEKMVVDLSGQKPGDAS